MQFISLICLEEVMNLMKIFSLLCVLLGSSISVAQDKKDLDLFIKNVDLKSSPIASFTENRIDLYMRFGELIELSEKPLSFSSFNEQGNLIQGSIPEAIGTFQHQSTYQGQGRLVEESFYNSVGVLVSNHKFNDQGNVIESLLYDTNGYLENRYIFNDQGKHIEWFGYNTNGSLRAKDKHKYDQQGNWLGFSLYNADGSLYHQAKCEYEYDSYSNWTKKACVDYAEQLGEWQPNYSVSDSEVTLRIIEYYE